MPEQPQSEDSPFPPVTEEIWRAAATRALGGRSPDELISRTRDGIELLPVYPEHKRRSFRFSAPPRLRAIARIDAISAADASAWIADDVAGGAEGLELVFATSPLARGAGLSGAPGILTQAIDATDCARLDAGIAGIDLVKPLPSVMPDLRKPPRLTLVFDRLALEAVEPGAGATHPKVLERLAHLPDGVGIAAADGRIWHEAGATEAQELAGVLASVVDWLRAAEAAGANLDRTLPYTSVVLTATPDILLTITKFRVAQLLLQQIMSKVRGSRWWRSTFIHAETSWRRGDTANPEMNVLRAGAAAFAACLGGAHTQTVLPAGDDRRARRVARNTSAILRDEAGLGKSDPSTSFRAVHLEEIGIQLARKAWTLFQEIESAGGLQTLVQSGVWQDRIATAAEAEEQAVRAGTMVLVGANRYVEGARPAGTRIPVRGPFLRPRLGDLQDAAAEHP